MSEIADHVRLNPPRCLSDVEVEPVDGMLGDLSDDFVVFRVSKDGHTSCQVRGYDLSDYNTGYDGPLQFISPLTLKWSHEPLICIFDSDIHGYHGELHSSAKLRGSGESTLFRCAQCNNDKMLVNVQFDYPDDLLDECDLADVPQYFQNIIVQVTCSECSTSLCLLDMDL